MQKQTNVSQLKLIPINGIDLNSDYLKLISHKSGKIDVLTKDLNENHSKLNKILNNTYSPYITLIIFKLLIIYLKCKLVKRVKNTISIKFQW